MKNPISVILTMCYVFSFIFFRLEKTVTKKNLKINNKKTLLKNPISVILTMCYVFFFSFIFFRLEKTVTKKNLKKNNKKT